MFLSLGIVSGEFRYQTSSRLLELPPPAARNTPHRPREVPHEIDMFVPVSALPCGPRSYQCSKLGFAKQVFSSPAACGGPETPNPVVGKSHTTAAEIPKPLRNIACDSSAGSENRSRRHPT